MNYRLYRPAFLAGIALLLAGCATPILESCEQFEQRRKQTNYATAYRQDRNGRQATDIKSLGKDELAAVRAYQLRLDPERARPCSHIKIHKDLVFVRRDNPHVAIEETREFFAESGTRIAVRNEVLTDQLRRSGRYTASVPLPIPKTSPPGKYRLTSTITLKIKGSTRVVTLAKAVANFQVVPLKQ